MASTTPAIVPRPNPKAGHGRRSGPMSRGGWRRGRAAATWRGWRHLEATGRARSDVQRKESGPTLAAMAVTETGARVDERPTFDLLDPDLYRFRQHEAFAWMRANEPVYRDEANGMWG